MKMKYLVAASLVVSAGTVHAQSSVVLYGVAETGLNYVSNGGGGRQFNMVSGEWYGSRWGLKGNEDLGGGLSAVFRLENGFDIGTGKLGQAGDEFGRAAYVGLQSNRLGTITLGRQYSTVYDFVGGVLAASSRWGGGFIAHAGDIDNLNNTFRVNNSVKFTSATYSGFSFGGLYSLGGAAGATNKNSGFGVGAAYNQGPLNLGIAFTDMQDPFLSAYNNGANAPAAVASPIYSAYVSAGSLQIFAAGGVYTIGKLWVGANFSNSRLKDLGSDPGNAGAVASLRGTAVINNGEFSAGYQFTPVLSATVGYDYSKRASVNGDRGATYNLFSLGADYALSKRTDFYLVAAYQKASGQNSNGTPAVAALNFLTPSTVNHQGVVRLAIRHLF